MCKPGDRGKLQRKGESEEGEGGSQKMKRREGAGVKVSSHPPQGKAGLGRTQGL